MRSFTHFITAALLVAVCGFTASSAQTVDCGQWTLEYIGDPSGSASDIVITKATGSGALDLSLVKGLNITGAIPSAFAYNSTLTSVNIPASFKNFSVDLEMTRSITGEPYTGEEGQAATVEGTGTIPLPFNLNDQPVRIVIHVTSDGSRDNVYGSCLLASGEQPFLSDSYAGGFQVFLQHASDGTQTLTVKDGTSATGTRFSHPTGSDFDVEVYFNPHYGFLMVSAQYSDGTVDSVTASPSDFSVSTLCYSLPQGVDETVSISDACMPFAGCSSLMSVTADSGNPVFSNGNDGMLLSAGGDEIAVYPYGHLFGKVIRLESVAEKGKYLSVDLYESGGAYEDRSADFMPSDPGFGTTLFKMEANDDGTCSFRHLNSGFLMGKKSNSDSAPLDAVQDPIHSGRYDYSLLPGSPLDAEFVFTDPYIGHVGAFDGVWMITDSDGKAVLEKNVSIAGEEHLFNIVPVAEVAVPVNSAGYATVCLPVDFTTPAGGVDCYIASEFDGNTGVLTIAKIPEGFNVPAGSGILLKASGKTAATLPIAQEGTQSPMFSTLFKGTNLRLVGAPATDFRLEGESFVGLTGGNLDANSAYIPASSLPASSATFDKITLQEGILTSAGIVTDDYDTDTPAYTLSGIPADPARTQGIIVTPKGKFVTGHTRR